MQKLKNISLVFVAPIALIVTYHIFAVTMNNLDYIKEKFTGYKNQLIFNFTYQVYSTKSQENKWDIQSSCYNDNNPDCYYADTGSTTLSYVKTTINEFAGFTNLNTDVPKSKNIIELEKEMGMGEETFEYQLRFLEYGLKNFPTIAGIFGPWQGVTNVEYVDIDKDGEDETIVSLQECGANCVYGFKIIKNDRIIFETPLLSAIRFQPTVGDESFSIVWKPHLDPVYEDYPRCCIPVHRTTKFKLVGNIYLPFEETETKYAKVYGNYDRLRLVTREDMERIFEEIKEIILYFYQENLKPIKITDIPISEKYIAETTLGTDKIKIDYSGQYNYSQTLGNDQLKIPDKMLEIYDIYVNGKDIVKPNEARDLILTKVRKIEGTKMTAILVSALSKGSCGCDEEVLIYRNEEGKIVSKSLNSSLDNTNLNFPEIFENSLGELVFSYKGNPGDDSFSGSNAAAKHVQIPLLSTLKEDMYLGSTEDEKQKFKEFFKKQSDDFQDEFVKYTRSGTEKELYPYLDSYNYIGESLRVFGK